MNLIKRVFVSITRRKVASLVILLVAFLMGNVMAVSISIQQSGQNIERNLLERIGGKIVLTGANISASRNVLSLDETSYNLQMNRFMEIYDYLASKNNIAYADYSLHFDGIDLVEGQNIELDESVQYPNGYSILHGIENRELIDEKERYIQFTNGEKFTEEQMKNGDNVLIVNEAVFIDGRPVKPNDVIEFEIKIEEYDPETNKFIITDKETFSYQVVGTFQVIDNKFSDVKNSNNIQMFYTPNQNVKNIYQKYSEMSSNERFQSKYWIDSATIVVSSSEYLFQLSESANSIVEEENYPITVTSTLDTVEKLISPVKSISAISQNILLFSMIAMTIILGLVSFYFIRDRKKEIGIYMSLGIRKSHLMLQIILESVLTGMVAIFLSIGSGWLISQQYSSSLLKNSLEVEESEYEEYMTDTLNYELLAQDVTDNYKITITFEDVSILIILSFSTILLSTAFPLFYIMRLDPKEILLE